MGCDSKHDAVSTGERGAESHSPRGGLIGRKDTACILTQQILLAVGKHERHSTRGGKPAMCLRSGHHGETGDRALRES